MSRWTYTGPSPAERAKLALEFLRNAGRPVAVSTIAAGIGCGTEQLTGNSVGTLLLLEVQGHVRRVGGGRGTKWLLP